jgi:N-glycosidase YbiA
MQAKILNATTRYEPSLPLNRRTNEIRFYGQRHVPYGVFSNFSDHPITIDGRKWKTSEHYFQAMKFVGTPYETQIRDAPTPGNAKTLGASRNVSLRADWETVKDRIMYDAVLAKFTQHDTLKTILLGTGDAIIIEHTSNDRYWGDGGDGTGRNQLGKTLMKVRDRIRNEETDKLKAPGMEEPDVPSEQP